MGETIRKKAAAAHILEDLRETWTNAQSRGGAWATIANDRIGETVTLAATIESRLAVARAAYAPLVAALITQDDLADRFLGRIADQIWNDVGRPASDPALSVLLPGGVAYYAEGDVEEQPDRMTLLAELLEAGVHPRLPPDKARGYAAEVRGQSAELQAKADAADRPGRTVAQLEKILAALARVGAAGLAALKRSYKAEGFSEAEIHQVIPDRQRPRKKSDTDRPPAA